MTMCKGVDELNMLLTVAEDTHFREEMWSGRQDFMELWSAMRDRAQWEDGYTAGLANAQYGSRMFDQLRSYEQQVAWQQERMGELDERIGELTAENTSLKRERTAVRRELGEFYCPLYPDTAEGKDLENSDSLWLDQGVNLATLKIDELTTERENMRLCLDEIRGEVDAALEDDDSDWERCITHIKFLAEKLGPAYMDVSAYARIEQDNEQLTAQLAEARAWGKAWKHGATINRDIAEELNRRPLQEQLNRQYEISDRLFEACEAAVLLVYGHELERPGECEDCDLLRQIAAHCRRAIVTGDPHNLIAQMPELDAAGNGVFEEAAFEQGLASLIEDGLVSVEDGIYRLTPLGEQAAVYQQLQPATAGDAAGSEVE